MELLCFFSLNLIHVFRKTIYLCWVLTVHIGYLSELQYILIGTKTHIIMYILKRKVYPNWSKQCHVTSWWGGVKVHTDVWNVLEWNPFALIIMSTSTSLLVLNIEVFECIFNDSPIQSYFSCLILKKIHIIHKAATNIKH